VLILPDRFRQHLDGLPAGVEVAWYATPEESLAAVADAEVLWFDPRTAAPIGDLLAAGTKLRWITSQNVGVDKLPLGVIRRRRILLTNAAGHYAIPISEYVVMALLAWAKGMSELLASQSRHQWLTAPPRMQEVAGFRALVIGYGGIGRAIGRRFKGLGIDTIGVRTRAAPPTVIGIDDWRPRLGEFDVVILSAPFTAGTRHLIGRDELALMKQGAWLANISRGPMIDTDALVEALRSGRLGGAHLDVTDPEPLPSDHPLWDQPNALITPHSSWASSAFARRTSEFFIANLARYQSGLRLRNLVKLKAGY
jgi:phosphoglycerate dehydrogenase-like enzyme